MVDVATILSQWESVGVFDYVLPFLLLFAIVFGILTATNILGHNKGIHSIVAIAVALLALRLDFVPRFFAEAFPRLGVGLAVILAVLICVGLFIPVEERKYWNWGLGTIGAVVAIVVITKSFDAFGSFGFGIAWDGYIGWIVGAVLLVGVIIAVGTSGSDKETDKDSGQITFTPFRSKGS